MTTKPQNCGKPWMSETDLCPRCGLSTAAHAGIVEQPQDWFFTFGVGHPLFKDKYVKIHGTYDRAREIMLSVFGRMWSHQYDAAGKAKSIDRYGLTELQ